MYVSTRAYADAQPAGEQDYQIDWEALLCQHCPDFVASVSSWLYPPAARGETGGSTQHQWDPTLLPRVDELLPTLRNRLEALNGPDLARVGGSLA